MPQEPVWEPEKPAGDTQPVWEPETPQGAGQADLPPPPVPSGLPGYPGKALLTSELEEPSTLRALARGAAETVGKSPYFEPVREAAKDVAEYATLGPRTATAEMGAAPKQAFAGLAQAFPEQGKWLLEKYGELGEATDQPLLGPLVDVATRGHPFGRGWPGALYESGMNAIGSVSSPAAIATLVAMGFAPADAQAMAGSFFTGQMAVASKQKFEEAMRLYAEGRNGSPSDQAVAIFNARKALAEGGLMAVMGALPFATEIRKANAGKIPVEELLGGRTPEGVPMPLLQARESPPLSGAQVVAQPETEARLVEKKTGPLASPEAKEAAKAPVATVPRPEEIAAMKVAEAERGAVHPEDMPPRLASAISTRRNLVQLADSLQSVVDRGGTVKDALPKQLDEGRGYNDILTVLEKGMRGEQLTSAQQAYFDKIYDWARQQGGKLTPLDLEAWVNASGLDVKTPTVLEQLEQEGITSRGPATPEQMNFNPTTLENRKPAGTSKTIVETTPDGERVAPLNPPDPDLRLEANRMVRSIAGGNDQATANALADMYNIQEPVRVERGTVRVAETTLADAANPAAGVIIRLPVDAEPYQLAHEILFEARKALGKDYTLPLHDDNAIAARLVGDLKEEGFDYHAVIEQLGEVLKSIPDPGGLSATEQAAQEADRLEALRRADNLKAMERGTMLSVQIPLLKPFVEQTVIPGVKKGIAGGAEAARSLVGALAPRALASDKAVDAVMKDLGAVNRQQAEVALNAEYARFQQQLDWIGHDNATKLIDAIKDGKTDTLGTLRLPWYATDVKDLIHGQATSVDLKRFANLFRQIDDAQYAQTDALLKSMGKDGLPWLDNHLRLFWKTRPSYEVPVEEIPGATGLGRAPLGGTGGFLRKMTFQNLSDGLAHGGVPLSYNPAVLGDLAWTDMAKFRAAATMMKDLQDGGFVKFVARGDRQPEGWKPLDDRIAKVYFPAESGEGMIHAGNYYFEPNVQRILSNYLSQDVIRQSLAGRGLLKWKNITTAAELAFSPFHAIVESIEAMGTAGGFSIERFNRAPFQKKPEMILRGIADWATAPYQYAKMGQEVRRYIASPDEFLRTPDGKRMLTKFGGSEQAIKDAVDALFTGGLKITAGQDYRLNSARTFAESLKTAFEDPGNANYVGLALRAFPFVNETVMRPLFNEYIPRLKLGAFLDEYSQNLLRNGERLRRGEISTATLARRSVDRVEDRFGEMNFDNLFWNRNFKTALQYLFRSVTWKLGNVRAVGRGITGQVADFLEPLEYLKQRAMGQPVTASPFPKFDPDMAWMVSTVFTTGILGSIVQKLGPANQFPWQTNTPLLDPFMPRSGGFDDNGRPNRWLLPSYMRDWLSARHSPSQYVKHGLSSTVGRTLEAWNNRDFYGNEIYDDRHPMVQRFFDHLQNTLGFNPTTARNIAGGAASVVEGAGHALGYPFPFTYSGAGQAALKGQPIGYPFAGLQPAPQSYQETPFETYVSSELGRRYETAPRRPEEAATAQDVKELRERALLGLPATKDIGRQRMAQVYRAAKVPEAFNRRAMSLSLEQLLAGWHLASKDEQDRLLGTVDKPGVLRLKATWKAIENIPADRRQNVIDQLRQIGGAPPVIKLGGQG